MIAVIAEKKKANVLDFFLSIFCTHIELTCICYVSPAIQGVVNGKSETRNRRAETGT